jgi:enterochelin esterase-like enzyme
MPEKKVKLEISFLVGLFLLLYLSACSMSSINEMSPVISDSTLVSVHITESPFPLTTVSPTPEPQVSSTTPDDMLCDEISGSLETYQIIREEVEISGRIYTPPCYEYDHESSYPTLYLLHGATEDDQQWIDLGIAETVDQLISDSSIAPLIIVMPLEFTWVALPENPFGDYLVTELLPWIESEYRTLPDRDYRAIGGLSRGGNWSLRIGLLHWGMFGSIGAHSTPMFYGDLERVPGWIEVIPVSRLPRIHLDIGESDNNLEAAQNLEDILSKLDVSHTWQLNPGLHDEEYWSAHLEDYLLWYSSGWDHLIQ